MEKAKVYFLSDITPENMIQIYEALCNKLPGNVAVKLHSGEVEKIWTADHDSFLESMADASKSIVEYFAGKIAFINVMCNMSVDCDCCAVEEDPAIADIGILASLDPVALDQACLDLVYASQDPGRDHLLERIESRNGVHTVEAAAELGVGSREYELVRL